MPQRMNVPKVIYLHRALDLNSEIRTENVPSGTAIHLHIKAISETDLLLEEQTMQEISLIVPHQKELNWICSSVNGGDEDTENAAFNGAEPRGDVIKTCARHAISLQRGREIFDRILTGQNVKFSSQ